MAVLYVLAGVNHFRDPGFYVPMMPSFLPLHRELVLISGVAEIALGLGLLVPRLRRASAWGIVALLIAVFPANLHVALNGVPLFGEGSAGVGNWIRLPFQIPLLYWAWWFTRVPPSAELPEPPK
jgi:uncharacterized membrane protein